MQNVITLRPDRPRPPRALGAQRGGARILFFTGVRYCRDEDETAVEAGPALAPALRFPLSELMLDAATH